MSQTENEHTAWWLALAGILPFIWLTIEIMLGTTWMATSPEKALIGYGALILSFLSGALWMRALSIEGNANLSTWLLTLAVSPSLLGFCAILMEGSASYITLLLGFGSILSIESYALKMEVMPAWFFRMRLRVTLAVMGILLLAWII